MSQTLGDDVINSFVQSGQFNVDYAAEDALGSYIGNQVEQSAVNAYHNAVTKKAQAEQKAYQAWVDEVDQRDAIDAKLAANTKTLEGK